MRKRYSVLLREKMTVLPTAAACCCLLGMLTVIPGAQAGNYTITDEAWFEVEVKDMDGPGQDYRGRFVIALFGETAPMTVMNFAAITRGYKRGKVSNYV